MKKSLIAAAGATIVAAAMPVVGVFAAGTYTDTVQVTVVKSCIFKAVWTDPTSQEQQEGDISAAGRTFSKDNVAPGTLLHFGGASDDDPSGDPGSSAAKPIIKMECNEGDGTDSGEAGSGTWTVAATGGQVSGKENKMVAGNSAVSGDIATGTATSGSDSNWAFKISATGGTVATGYGDWHEIPGSSSVNVLSGTATSGAEITFTPQYQVYIGTDAKADTYTGKVVYTLSSTFAN